MYTETTYNPNDFASVMGYLYRTFGADVFGNPPRMYAIFCDLSPRLKPYGNIVRQLAERGLLTALERASRDHDDAAQVRLMMKARDCLENELLLGADRVTYFLSVLGDLYGVAPPDIPGPVPQVIPQYTPQPVTQPIPQPVQQPQTLPMSGHSGRLTWTLDSAGLLTISGDGDMDDFTRQAYHQSSAPWCVRQAALTEVVIKNGVRGIGQEAFYYCANIRRVTMPDTLTRIDYMAFRGCAGLKRVTIPRGVTEIGTSAFEGCTALTGVKIPRGVTVIQGHAFAECRNLASVTIPNSVQNIGYRAFRDCAKLSRAYVPAGADIDDEAFDSTTTVIRW